MRVRKKPWALDEILNNKQIISEPEILQGKWNSFFGNDKPIHLEIGCGKGKFITENSENFNDINFLALEKEKSVIVTGARATRDKYDNLGFIIGKVEDISNFFAPSELKRIYINFCDPWPNKKKWHKRRLTHRNFLKVYKELLSDSGEIFFKTDNAELFEFSLNEFSSEGFMLRNITLDLHNSSFESNIETEYEIKFSSKGMPIYRLEAICNKVNMPD